MQRYTEELAIGHSLWELKRQLKQSDVHFGNLCKLIMTAIGISFSAVVKNLADNYT